MSDADHRISFWKEPAMLGARSDIGIELRARDLQLLSQQMHRSAGADEKKVTSQFGRTRLGKAYATVSNARGRAARDQSRRVGARLLSAHCAERSHGRGVALILR